MQHQNWPSLSTEDWISSLEKDRFFFKFASIQIPVVGKQDPFQAYVKKNHHVFFSRRLLRGGWDTGPSGPPSSKWSDIWELL